MSEKLSENSEMSELAFAQDALKKRVAPKGETKGDRIRLAARRLGWKHSRTKDVWYADEKIRIQPKELRDIEEVTGLVYQARTELTEIDRLLARADALLDGPEADFHRPMVAALHAFVSALNRPGA